MFYEAAKLTTLDVSNWDTSRLNDMSSMFDGASALTTLDVSKWDTSKVTNMERSFQNTSSLTSLDVSRWDTSSVRDMDWLFYGADALPTLDLSNWDTSSNGGGGTDMFNAASLWKITIGPKFSWGKAHLKDAPSVSPYTGAWREAVAGDTITDSSITSIATGTRYTSTHTEYGSSTMPDPVANTTYVWEVKSGCDWNIDQDGKLTITPANGISCILTNSSEGTSGWGWDSRRAEIKSIELGTGVILGPNLNSMLASTQLDNLDASDWDTSRVTDMGAMFAGTKQFTKFNATNWDTSHVTNMVVMFASSSIQSILASNWDTSHVTNMGAMFAGTTNLSTIDVSKWDTSQVTDMDAMFADAKALATLDLSNWDTSKVTSIGGMLAETPSLWKISIGPKFSWKDTHQTPNSLNAAPTTTPFTGAWREVMTKDVVTNSPLSSFASGSKYTDPASIPSNPSAKTTYIWDTNSDYAHKITYVEPDKNGKVATDVTKATKDAPITVDATPNPGYKKDQITAVDDKGNNIPISDDGAFTMPDSDVIVTTTFKPDPSYIPTNPATPTTPTSPNTADNFSQIAIILAICISSIASFLAFELKRRR